MKKIKKGWQTLKSALELEVYLLLIRELRNVKEHIIQKIAIENYKGKVVMLKENRKKEHDKKAL